MAAVSLFWDTNMAAVTSLKTLYGPCVPTFKVPTQLTTTWLIDGIRMSTITLKQIVYALDT